MQPRKPSLISTQIPLITLIAVLLSLCVFTFPYASTSVPCLVTIFSWLSNHGGRIILGSSFVVFVLAVFGFATLLIKNIVNDFGHRGQH